MLCEKRLVHEISQTLASCARLNEADLSKYLLFPAVRTLRRDSAMYSDVLWQGCI